MLEEGNSQCANIGAVSQRSIGVYFLLMVGLLLFALLFLSGGGEGRTITVDDDGEGEYTEFTEAVRQALSGDEIYIMNGTYFGDSEENAHIWEILDENISIIGESRENSILHGMRFSYASNWDFELADARFFNLTIRGDGSRLTLMNAKRFIFQNCTFVDVDFSVKEGVQYLTMRNLDFHDSHFSLGSNSYVSLIYGREIVENYCKFITLSNISYHNTPFVIYPESLHQIYSFNLENISIDGDSLRYFVDANNVSIENQSGIFYFFNCTRITISDCSLEGNTEGIVILFSREIFIRNCTFLSTTVDVAHSNNIQVSNSSFTFENSDRGYSRLIVVNGTDIDILRNSMNTNVHIGALQNSKVLNNTFGEFGGLFLSEGDNVTINGNEFEEIGITFLDVVLARRYENLSYHYLIEKNFLKGKPIGADQQP